MGNTETHHSYHRASTPEKDQIVIQKDPTAYTFLYASLGFAGIVFLLLVIGFWWNNRKAKQKEQDAQAHQGFPNSGFPETAEQESFYDGRSVVVSPIQPKSDLGYNGVDYPRNPQAGRGLTFGCYTQQTPQPPQTAQMMMQSEALMETLAGNRRAGHPGHGHSGHGHPGHRPSLAKDDSMVYVPGRHESLDVYYAMEPEEKTPLQKTVDNKQEFKSYLHLTTELSRENSLEEAAAPTTTDGFTAQEESEDD